MASSSSSHSAPVSSSQSWKYDVFLSFKGDTRKTFVGHLYKALVDAGIYTYKDDQTLPRGELIGPTLEAAIEESRISLIIFSVNYANSTWCLNELKHIMKCRDERNQTVLPIFYDVEPTEVRNQKEEYKAAFEIYELENNEEVGSWRKALKDAGKLSGWETKLIANGYEAEGIEQIVGEVLQRLNLETSGANENLIGMRTRVQVLKSKLQIESGGVRMLGIWGVGGGGKTTLASFIYDDISSMYDACCFVDNVREDSSKIGLKKLQEKILSGISKQKQVEEVRRVEEGKQRLKARLHHRKVLIVVDDVDQHDQLEALVGSHDWFGEGSRIIITTRDQHLLNVHRVDVVHEIILLNHDESVTLFRKHAHKGNTPMKDSEHLIEKAVSYSGGLPLALTVLGAFLCDKNVSQWRSALAKLKQIPEKDIIGKLRISFDGLEKDQKELFLEIACFFRRKKKDRAMEILHACGFHPVIGVKVLRQKALVFINEDGEFDMHDLVQEMGHYIVRREHPKNPEKHSRVWKRKDVSRVLNMAATMNLDNIEAIEHQDLSYEESQRFLQVAGNMNKLRWIDLHSFPHKQLWEGYKHLPNLTHMELHHCRNLIKIPDFSGLPNLETFKIYQCTSLKEIHPSIGRLERLVFLSIDHCSSPPLPAVECCLPPNNMNFRRLQFSNSALRKLVLSCYNLRDEEIGSGFLELPNLEQLDLSENRFISRLDFRILRLPRLKWLNVSWCTGLVELLELPSSIVVVIADHCWSLESFGDISNCKWLWKVSLKWKNKLDQLHGDTLIHSMLQGNASEDHFISVGFQDQFPSRFVGRLFRRKTFRLHLPDDWYKDYRGFIICVVTNLNWPAINITMKQEDPPFDLSQESYEAVEPIYGERTKTFVGYVPFSSLRHTTFLTSSYNIISFTIEELGYINRKSTSYSGIEFIPRKSKSDEVQTTDSSEFWDKYSKTFMIHQCDSESSVEIAWKPIPTGQ